MSVSVNCGNKIEFSFGTNYVCSWFLLRQSHGYICEQICKIIPIAHYSKPVTLYTANQWAYQYDHS